jgi:hypothetical protein
MVPACTQAYLGSEGPGLALAASCPTIAQAPPQDPHHAPDGPRADNWEWPAGVGASGSSYGLLPPAASLAAVRLGDLLAAAAGGPAPQAAAVPRACTFTVRTDFAGVGRGGRGPLVQAVARIVGEDAGVSGTLDVVEVPSGCPDA